MKKFSTAALILALAPVFTTLSASQAHAADKNHCAFRADAPDKHVVVKGNTLWGISGRFLERPWCWPQVWGMNREQIRNPHWIYPGQVVYLDRAAGRLRLGQPTTSGDVRLSPQIRITDGDKSALSTIDGKLIEPFMVQPLIVDENDLNDAPRIIASTEGRVKMGAGDRVYVRGDLKGGGVFNVFRSAEPLIDPETKKIIGYEAVHVGTVQLVRAGKFATEAHAFTVLEMKQEIGMGDRLILKPPHQIVNYVPHPPEKQVDARVMSVYDGLTHAAKGQIVSINRGMNDGIDVGTVLKLYRIGELILDRDAINPMFRGPFASWFSNKNNQIQLPDEESGTLFVFRVFDKVSYGLIMESSNNIVVGDVAKSPELPE